MKQAEKGNWQILGAGAQGLLWAARLGQAGVSVTLRLQPERAALQQIHYLHGECQQTVPAHSLPLTQRLPAWGLLVTVKATDLATALTAYLADNPAPTLLVLLQNGIGAEAIARERLPAATVIWLGTSTHGSFRRGPDAVVHAGEGGIWLGPGRGALTSPEHAAALSLLKRSELQVSWDDHIATRLWHKLAINSCINPLTALLNCRNGELLHNATARHWLPLLAQEAAAVCSAEGHPISAEQLLQRVDAIATATADNYNSMQQDFSQARRTEIAFITGTLLQTAARHQLPAPHHAEMLTRVEQRRRFGV